MQSVDAGSKLVGASRLSAIVLPFISAGWLAAFLYLGLASQIPSIPWVTGRPGSVALAGHFSFSLVMAVLLYGSMRGRGLTWPSVPVLAASFLAASAIGGSIEGLQALTADREPNMTDFLFDVFGAGVAVALLAPLDGVRQLRPALVTAIGAVGVFVTGAIVVWLGPDAARLVI